MSWAEVSKINSDFMDIPLDKRLDLADYKMYGEKSHVFQNKDRLHSLYECIGLSMNDLTIYKEAFEHLAKNNKAGAALAGIYGIKNVQTLVTLTAMQAVVASSTAMQAVAASSTAMQVVAESNSVIKAVLLNLISAQAIAKSTTALNALEKSSHLKKIVGRSKTASGKLIILKGIGNAYNVNEYAYYIIENSSKTENVDALGSFIKLYPGQFATYIRTDNNDEDTFYYFDVA